MKYNILGILILVILLTSCAFDKMFLHPQKFPDDIKMATLAYNKTNDTVIIKFVGEDHFPEFYNTKQERYNPGFNVESMGFKSANGNYVNAWLLKPSDSVEVTATILHLHGNSGSLLHQFTAIAPLVDYGFQVFLFDYSGFGFSSGKATQENALIDALSALEYLKSRNDVRSTDLVIYGQSFGGFLAAKVAADREEEIAAAVIEGAFTTTKDIAAYTSNNMFIPGFFARIFVASRFDAISSVKKYKKPLLVIHSSEDDVIPFFMGQEIFKAANEPKVFMDIDSCHICGPKLYTEKIAKAIKVMLQKN